jgi:hypothetical protein
MSAAHACCTVIATLTSSPPSSLSDHSSIAPLSNIYSASSGNNSSLFLSGLYLPSVIKCIPNACVPASHVALPPSTSALQVNTLCDLEGWKREPDPRAVKSAERDSLRRVFWYCERVAELSDCRREEEGTGSKSFSPRLGMNGVDPPRSSALRAVDLGGRTGQDRRKKGWDGTYFANLANWRQSGRSSCSSSSPRPAVGLSSSIVIVRAKD